MNDGVQRARERRNALERLAAKIPGLRGYIERETRREVDKLERDWIAARLDQARSSVQRSIREWSRSGNLENLDLASSVEKLLARLANRVRHTDYGYTGFFDAVKVSGPQLDRLYEFDLGLVEVVEGIAARIDGLPGSPSEPALRSVLESVEAADRTFDERATVFEDLTQRGDQ